MHSDCGWSAGAWLSVGKQEQTSHTIKYNYIQMTWGSWIGIESLNLPAKISKILFKTAMVFIYSSFYSHHLLSSVKSFCHEAI